MQLPITVSSFAQVAWIWPIHLSVEYHSFKLRHQGQPGYRSACLADTTLGETCSDLSESPLLPSFVPRAVLVMAVNIAMFLASFALLNGRRMLARTSDGKPADRENTVAHTSGREPVKHSTATEAGSQNDSAHDSLVLHRLQATIDWACNVTNSSPALCTWFSPMRLCPQVEALEAKMDAWLCRQLSVAQAVAPITCGSIVAYTFCL